MELGVCSFVVFAFLHFLSIDDVTGFGTPEISNELPVSFVVNIQFSDLVIFKLRVFLHFLWDSLSSEEPDSLDLKVGFFSQDCVHGEGVLSEVVESLEEAIQQVGSLIENFTLAFVHLVV